MPLSDTYVDSDTLGKRYEEIVKLSEVPSLQNNTGKFVAFVNGQGKVHALIYYTGRKYYGVYFSDTQQYTAYEDGEATDAGNFSSTAYNDYYSTVFIILPLICQLTMNEMIYQRIFGLVPVFA